MSRPEPTPLARALGRIPSGLYVACTRRGERPVGFVASFVQQVAFEPPTVVLAVGREREQLADLRRVGRFTLSIVGEGGQALLAPFLRRDDDLRSPFGAVEVASAPSGMPVLADALAWLDCRIAGEHEAGDHVVLFGVVEDGAARPDGTPRVHVRRNGLAY